MKIFIIDSIFFFLLIAFFSNSVFSATSENASLESAKPITKNESEISVAETGSRAAQSTNSSNKKNSTYNELVVVSKNPDFFSYILSSIAILLTVITILVGVITGTGLAIVIKLYRERKKLEEIRVSFDKEQKEIRAKLKNDYEKMTVALERTAFRLANFHTAKRTLRDTLSKPNPSVNEIYLLLEKTIKYPDVECLQLYSKALELFESNFDIVRLIRNGIMQFARNPEKL